MFYIILEERLNGLKQYFPTVHLKIIVIKPFQLIDEGVTFNSSSTSHHESETIKHSHTSGEQNLPFSICNNLSL